MVPAIFLVLMLVTLQAMRKQEDAEASALRVARALAVAVDAQLREVETSLAVLAVSPSLQDADFGAFHKQALSYQASMGLGTVVVLDAEGRQLVNTSRPHGSQLPALGERAPAMWVIQNGKPMARVIKAPSDGRPIAVVSVPVLSQGRVRFALSTTLDFARFEALLSRQQLPPSWIGVILDPARTVVARTSDSARFVGTRASRTLVDALAGAPEGGFDGVSLDGIAVRTLYSSARAGGWSVAVGVPKAELARDLQILLFWLSLSVVFVLGVAVLGAWWYAERIGRAVRRLNEAARQLGRGEAVSLEPLGILEADQLAVAMARASSELRSAGAVLARNEARWSAVLESAMDGIVAVDESQRIVIYNPAAEAIFGWSRDEAMGQPLGMLIPPAQREAHVALVRQFGRTGETSRRMGAGTVVSGLRKNGVVFPIEASISHLDTGEGMLYTVIIRDVTEAVQARQELGAMAAEASRVREQEKSRIARELHDELAQSLAVVRIDLVQLRSELAPAHPDAAQTIASVVAEIDSCVAATRRIAADLRPLILDDLGLAAAIEWLADEFTARTGVPCALRSEGDLDLPEPYATGVFRILQEALANVAKHARARHVQVDAERGPSELLLAVEDDGIGFDTTASRKPLSLGMAGLRERAHLLQGKLAVTSQPGQGTRVEVRLPAPAAASGD